MIYNRCVGTAIVQQLPLQGRRFNFFDYNRRPLEQLQGPVYTTPLTHSTDGEWDLCAGEGPGPRQTSRRTNGNC